MFRDKEGESHMDQSVSDNTTILKEDATFEGKLIFEGNVLVNGKFKGEIYSSGELIVGKSGLVEGDVQIGSIIVHGNVNGNIKAKQKIVINAPAEVRGDIVAPSLIIEEGAVFEGNCAMGQTSSRSSSSFTSTSTANEEDVSDNVVDLANG